MTDAVFMLSLSSIALTCRIVSGHLPEAEREPRLFMKSVWSELHAEWQRGDYFLAVGLRGEQGELADSQTTSSAYMIIIAACGTTNGDADSPSSAMPWVIHYTPLANDWRERERNVIINGSCCM